MAWRFRRSVKIAPGVRLNVGKKSVGLSVGGKGFRVGVNSKKGVYTSASIPGTGLYTQQYLGSGKSRGKQGRQGAPSRSNSSPASPAQAGLPIPQEIAPSNGLLIAWGIGALLALAAQPVLGIALVIGLVFYAARRGQAEQAKAWRMYQAAAAAYQANQPEVAAHRLLELLEIYPGILSLRLPLAELLHQQGDYLKAIEHYELYLDSFPSEHEVTVKLGHSLYFAGRFEQAIALLQALPAGLKQELTVINLLAGCYLELGQYQLAENILLTGPTRRRNMDEQLLLFRYLLGVTYQELGKKRQAVNHLQRVYSFDAQFADVAARLAALEEGTGARGD